VFDKTIKLTGEYPSDWKPPNTIVDIQKTFAAFDFYDGRMIGGSKWQYSELHPKDLVVYNANVLMPDYGKVWYGDLNLTEDYLTLREIAQILNTDLYILWESDGRFGEENNPIDELMEKAVWNTKEDMPTLDWLSKKRKAKYDERTT